MATLSTHVCRRCRSHILNHSPLRAFSTTLPQHSIPPEAPTYIDVPQSHQPDLIIRRRPKGVLPVPREIFPPRQPDKPSEAYIARATREKSAKNVIPDSQLSEREQYRRRMATLRKSHLREGLTELHQRSLNMTRQLAMRSEHRQRQRQDLLAQAARVDEQLTNATIPQSMVPVKGAQLQLADAKATYERKRANLARHRAAEEEHRKDALHTLYMNARDFITTEEQLDAEIEKTFPAGPHPEWGTSSFKGENIWNTGAPPTIADMLDAGKSRGRSAFSRSGMAESAAKYRLDQERMKRIAEELSGGKM